MVSLLVVAAVGGSAGFLLTLFRSDKVQTLLLERARTTGQAAGRLERLVELARAMDLEKVRDSEDVVFLYDNACSRVAGHEADGPAFRGVVSRRFERVFTEIGWDPSLWTGMELFHACDRLGSETSADVQRAAVVIVPPIRELPFPAITVLLGIAGAPARFAMLRVRTGAGESALFDRGGHVLWASSGAAGLSAALDDVALAPEELAAFAHLAFEGGPPGVVRAGRDGLVSYARSGADWAWLELADEAEALRPVTFAIRQLAILGLGLVLACLLAGRNAAERIARPFAELKAFAERLATGELSHRLALAESEEPTIATVKGALNTMTDRVVELLHSTEEKAHLEQDLQVAHQVQQMLLPQGKLDDISGHRFASHAETASQCGGDWWGYTEVQRKGKGPLLVVLIGDVVGHGTGPALVTGAARGGLSMLASWARKNPSLAEDPGSLTSHLNSVVWDAAKGSLSMTLFAVVIDADADVLRVVNAGHNLPYMIVPEPPAPPEPGKPALKDTAPRTKLIVLGRSGIPLGYEPRKKYPEVESYPWTPGCKLVLFTDGLTEMIQGETPLYDRKALKRALRAHGALSAQGLLDELMRERAVAVGGLPPQDDTTLVICERIVDPSAPNAAPESFPAVGV